MISIK